MSGSDHAVTGVANGVPFVALPPATARPDAPVVFAWHLIIELYRRLSAIGKGCG
jgi:hypothetical protein